MDIPLGPRNDGNQNTGEGVWNPHISVCTLKNGCLENITLVLFLGSCSSDILGWGGGESGIVQLQGWLKMTWMLGILFNCVCFRFSKCSLVVWGPLVWIHKGSPLWEALLLRGTPIRIPNHRAPNHQLSIMCFGWKSFGKMSPDWRCISYWKWGDSSQLCEFTRGWYCFRSSWEGSWLHHVHGILL